MLETKECKVEKALTLFVEAVELSANLEVIGTAYPVGEDGEPDITQNECFVIRDYSKTEGIEGAYVEVSIKEIVSKVSDMDKASEFIRVIANERNPIVLHGITRIVGYYSRVTAWNKSKIGELRDRTPEYYALGGRPQDNSARTGVIDRVE